MPAKCQPYLPDKKPIATDALCIHPRYQDGFLALHTEKKHGLSDLEFLASANILNRGKVDHLLSRVKTDTIS